MHYRLYFDGGARPNPGKGGCGAECLESWTGSIFTELWTGSWRLGDYCTSNEAEYHGLINGLRKLRDQVMRDIQDEKYKVSVEAMGDSELVIKQMKGEYAVDNEDLQILHRLASGLCIPFVEGLDGERFKVKFKAIPRRENQVADSQATAAVTEEGPFDDGTFEYYRPNLCSTSLVDFPSAEWQTTVRASNDFSAGGCTDKFLIDAQLFRELYGLDAFDKLRHSKKSILTGKVKLNILGEYPSAIPMLIRYDSKDCRIVHLPGGKVSIENAGPPPLSAARLKRPLLVTVVHHLPVPVHVHIPDGPGHEDWGSFVFTQDERLSSKHFGPPYNQHPWYFTNTVRLP